MTTDVEGCRRRRTTTAIAASMGVWAGVLFAAAAGGGCGAPTPIDEVASRSQSLSGSLAITSALGTPPGVLRSLLPVTPAPSLICDSAIVFTTGACVAVPNWTGRRLIFTANGNYCHYSWSGIGLADFTAFSTTSGTVEPDCPVVGLATAAPSLDSGLLTDLANTFRNQIEGPAIRSQPHQPGGGEIRVVAVDSAAKPYTLVDNSVNDNDTFGHGRLVGRTIADLACPQDPLRQDPSPDSCTLAIQNRLAVPRVPDLAVPSGVADWINGGYFGTRGELGDAIADALADWEAGRMAADRLILNLSLGWEANLPPETTSGIANEAIATLLERASCEGALAIAAAGNQAGPGSVSGPFLPASWESRLAPDVASCQVLWPKLAVDPSATKQRPLVYAVAAVDDQDRPLLTTRLGGAPRLVATGIAAVTSDGRRPGNTLVLSGSSIAAAVASGVAAAVWETDGALAGPAVMDLIYGSAVDLPVGGINPATVVCLNPPCERQRRVSLCGALTEINARHQLPSPCPTIPTGAGASPAVPVAPASVNSVPTMCAGCATGATPPPEKPWVWPQPNIAACPSCLFIDPTICGSSGVPVTGLSVFGVQGQIDPAFADSINSAVAKFNANPANARTPGAQAQVTSVAARLVQDSLVQGSRTTDFSLATAVSPMTTALSPMTLSLVPPTWGTSRATISFSIGLSGVPGTNVLTTSPQDVPVACQ